MTWIEAARGPFERLLDAQAEEGTEAIRARLEGLRLAYLDLRAGGADRPLAEGLDTARTKGPWVLWMLRKLLSPPVFQPVREAWGRGEALETGTLRELAERLARADLGAFFDFWVYGSLLPEYRLLKAEARREGDHFAVTLQVQNLGSGACEVPLVVQTEEGARHELGVSISPGQCSDLQCRLLTQPVAATVDPEADILMATGERPWLTVRVRKFWIF
jgi:hypothetical protein